MRKKLGPLFWGSQELKLFESVVVEFMLQELEFHIPPCPTRFLSYLRTGFGW